MESYMSFWIVFLILGLVCTVLGFRIFFKNPGMFNNRKSMLLVGIFLPIILAFSYGENLIKEFPANLTSIDLGGFLILGIISGIFTACYFLSSKV